MGVVRAWWDSPDVGRRLGKLEKSEAFGPRASNGGCDRVCWWEMAGLASSGRRCTITPRMAGMAPENHWFYRPKRPHNLARRLA